MLREGRAGEFKKNQKACDPSEFLPNMAGVFGWEGWLKMKKARPHRPRLWGNCKDAGVGGSRPVPLAGFYLAITRITASLATLAPGSKLMALMVPLAGAGRLFCIFMASRIHTRSPVLTWSPTLTL